MDWDVSSFGNEQAQAWLKSITGALSGDLIDETLGNVDRSEIFIDGQDAERGIAAAEVVAASHGKSSQHLPGEIGMWLKAQNYKAPKNIVKLASRVVEKVSKNSELRDLWDGTDAAVDWQRAMKDLRERLDSIELDQAPEKEEPELLGQEEEKESDVSPEAFFNEAVELVASGNHRGAVAKFNHALELDEDYVLGYIGRGTSFLALGKYVEAVTDFNHAIDREPDIGDAYYLRAQAYFQQSNYGRAIADLTILLNMAPGKLEAYVMRGLANFSLGRDKKAIEDFTKALSKDPTLANAYYHRAKVYEREGQFDLAGKDRREYEKLVGAK